MELVPYTGKRPSVQQQLEPGVHQGVVIFVSQGHGQMIMEKIDAWFEERDEIILVDSGETMKTKTGFIILEWEEVEVDPLFLKILENEEVIEDYTVYTREGAYS
jgi:hypothetical protein